MRNQLVFIIAAVIMLGTIVFVFLPVQHGDGISEVELRGRVLAAGQAEPLELVQIIFQSKGSVTETVGDVVALSGNEGAFSIVCRVGWWYEARGLDIFSERVCHLAPVTLRFEREGYETKDRIFENLTFRRNANSTSQAVIDVGTVEMSPSEQE